MNTIMKVSWFTQMGSPHLIGMVVMSNGFETKCYLGTAEGQDEDQDIEHIIKTGARVFPSSLIGTLEELTRDIIIPESVEP